MDLAFICYSHSEYSDVWDMFFGQLNEFIPNSKKYLFTNELVKDVPKDVEVIIYDDTVDYSNKVLKCLSTIKEKFCIFHQEDMVLYDKPNLIKIEDLYNFLSEYKVDYIKLLKGGHVQDIPLDKMPIDNLFWIPHTNLSYTNQPTIWKMDSLKLVFEKTPNTSIRDFEIKASNYVNTSNLLGLYWHAGEEKRGLYHWDSSVYPFGGMISKGKWVYSEYNKELTYLHKKYDVDKTLRGVI